MTVVFTGRLPAGPLLACRCGRVIAGRDMHLLVDDRPSSGPRIPRVVCASCAGVKRAHPAAVPA